MDRIRKFFRDVTSTPPRLVAALAILLIVVGAVGYGTYQVFGPTLRGVLPLPATEFVQGEFLVKFKPGTPADARRSLNAQNRTEEMEEIPGIAVARLKVPAGSSVSEMVNIYGRNPNVEFAEPNYVRGAADGPASGPPNDPAYPNQWALAKINAAGAWAITTGSSAVTIAILDSGIDRTHEDFAGRLIGTPALDDNGHGTQVAGLAAAATNNGKGVAGVCWTCPIMSIKVLGSTGTGSDSAVSAGIIGAADAGAKVINLSLGAYVQSLTMKAAVDYAWGKGVVLVGAAGNDGQTVPFYPAAFEHVISVGSTTSSDAKASISNYGSWLQVMAPGTTVSTTRVGNTYTAPSGTSMAAPFVAGLAALIFSANPSITNQQVVDLILGNTDPLPAGSTGRNDTYGFGRINAKKAVEAAGGAVAASTAVPVATATPTPAPTATPTPAPTATPTPAPTAEATATPTPTPALLTETFTGSVAATGTSQREYAIPAGAGTLSANLGGWTGNANNNKLDLYLFSGSTQLAAVTTTARPKDLTFVVPGPGVYTVRVVAASGSGNYTLGVSYAPAPAGATLTPAPTAAPTPTPEPTATPAPSPTAAPLVTDTFTGSVAANGTSQQEHTITVAAAGPITASVGGWSGNPNNNNLDLYLLSGSTQLASATTTSRPETLTLNITTPGTYILRVVATSGSGNYTLTVTHP